jgi:cysteine desulfurase/selenocysteine lyase
LANFRNYFPFFSQVKFPIYLDNAATTQKPAVVLQAMHDWYINSNANVHRGIYDLAEQATAQYEGARSRVAQFVHAKPHEIVFVSGATAGLNAVAHCYEHMINQGDRIVVTALEHHSNFVCWQQLAHKKGAEFVIIPVDYDGRLMVALLDELITSNTKIVAFSYVSHAIGTEIDAQLIIKKAKSVGAFMCVDGAQAVAHQPIDLSLLDVDAFVFSGHKMYGPLGIGVLYLNERVHHLLQPFMVGGGMVGSVFNDSTTFQKMPYLLEAGTPPVAQAVGLVAAIDFITKTVTYPVIIEHEKRLFAYAFERLTKVSGLTVIGEKGYHVISFVVHGFHPHDVAAFLNTKAIAVRAGNHCAQPLARALLQSAWIRVSFGLYTKYSDIDALCDALFQLRLSLDLQ